MKTIPLNHVAEWLGLDKIELAYAVECNDCIVLYESGCDECDGRRVWIQQCEGHHRFTHDGMSEGELQIEREQERKAARYQQHLHNLETDPEYRARWEEWQDLERRGMLP